MFKNKENAAECGNFCTSDKTRFRWMDVIQPEGMSADPFSFFVNIVR